MKKPGALSPSHRAFSRWPPDFSPTTKLKTVVSGRSSVVRTRPGRKPKTKFSIICDRQHDVAFQDDLKDIILFEDYVAAATRIGRSCSDPAAYSCTDGCSGC